ncbi:MAG: hypothetical protein GY950_27320, partial [bacterium]|nr:hypothetical protein [bacterium]
MKKTGILLIILLWPVLVLTGWMVYPFLVTGFLWLYLNDNERKTISYLLIAVGVLSILYSFNLMMERSAVDRNFKTVQKVYAGHLFEREAYEKFDNELKVAQAFSYYQNNQYETALSILLSTGKEYKNRLKYDLMGSLYHLSENYSESINHYVESLRLDDSTEATLNNFTLTLLKNNREDVFESYTKLYP